MATFDFNESAADIVRNALEHIGAIEEEETLTAAALQQGIRFLNKLIKTWQRQDVHLWRKTESVLFLNEGQFQYKLGPNGDRTAEEEDFIETTLDGNFTAGNTNITVLDTTGMAVNDEIGIFINNSLRFWTTIAAVVNSTDLTLTDALSDDANSGATVFTFTERIQRPLRIGHGRRRAGGPSVSEIPTFALSHDYYFDLTTRRTARGLPVEHYYKPTLILGDLFLWPVPSSVDFLFKFTSHKALADIDVNSDLTDFPTEWLDALTFNLSKRLMHSYRTPIAERDEIRKDADETLEAAMNFDREYAPMRIMPDYRGMRRR